MKLIVRFSLASKSTSESRVLRREALRAFDRDARGSQDRSDALHSLANLDAEIASRPEL